MKPQINTLHKMFATALLASLSAAGAMSPAALGQTAEPKAIKFTLSWLPQSVDAPLYVAQEKGYFERAGVKVTVDRGFGSADAAVKIGTGQYPIGEADIYSMIEFNSKQTPDKQLVAVAVKYQRSPLAILSLKQSGIDTPQKLAGKRIGDIAGAATVRLFPVYAKQAGFSDTSVTWSFVEARLRELLLTKGQFDAAGAFTLTALPPLRKMGFTEDKLNILYYADAGMELYGNGIVTSRAFARDNPAIVAAVVRGYLEGLKDTLANPDAALDTVTRSMKGDVGWDVESERYRLRLTIDKLYVDPRDKKTVGIGSIDKKRFEIGVKQVAQGFGIARVPPVSEIFDDRFLPPIAERQ